MKKEQISYNFSAEKNKQLIQERNISFEEVIAVLNNGQVLDAIKHPNQVKYPHQMMYLVEIKDYVFLVPYVKEREDSIFLKTIIPSRKARKKYQKEVDGDET